jgi:putative endonuclease
MEPSKPWAIEPKGMAAIRVSITITRFMGYVLFRPHRTQGILIGYLHLYLTMAEHNELGEKGEDLAAKMLEQKGYEVLDRNWRWGRYEIDIVAKKNNLIIVSEVKTRRSNYFGEPEEFVSVAQQKRLVASANEYIERFNLDLEVRFDIISIIYNSKQRKVHHIEDAFYAR